MIENWPETFLKSSAQWPGFEQEAFLKAHRETPPISIRLHPEKGVAWTSELKTKQVSWCSDGWYLSERPEFIFDPAFHAGAYYVQEASSMSIGMVLEEYGNPEEHPRVLDLCAAPGGKSTLIASWLRGRGFLVANETIKTRAGVLAEQLRKWGYANTLVSNNDPQRFSALEGYFDIVLADAPCSGSGLFRKDPAASGHWSIESVKHCSARQQRIVSDVWPALREGGIFIYSTCSFSREENEMIAARIMDMGAEHLNLSHLENSHPGVFKSEPGYRFYPDRISGEGFYLAAFRKTAGHRHRKIEKQGKISRLPEQMKDWIRDTEKFALLKSHLGELAVPLELMADFRLILEKLHVVRAGLLPGEFAGKDFVPDHDLALSLLQSPAINKVELDYPAALRFLKKETEGIPHPGKGWFLASYQGLGLGWIKGMQGRINNYLPKNLRIVKELRSTDNSYLSQV